MNSDSQHDIIISLTLRKTLEIIVPFYLLST